MNRIELPYDLARPRPQRTGYLIGAIVTGSIAASVIALLAFAAWVV